jgi:hypothetical protein
MVLDDRRFTDPRLRVNRAGRERRGQAKRGDIENAVTPIHKTTDRLSRSSYRIASACDVASLPQAARYGPMVSHREIEMRSMRWTLKYCPPTLKGRNAINP